MTTRSYRWLFVGLAVIGLTLDQASKYLIFKQLYNEGLGGKIEVVPGVFRLLAQFDPSHTPNCDCILATWSGPVSPRVNHGALFGLGNEHQSLANAFFAGVSLLAALAIAFWGTRRSTAQDWSLSMALGLILAGTLGNLYDRLIFGGVRDFLHFYYIDWPVFNIADCCLVVGASILLVQAFFGSSPKDSPTAAHLAETRG